MRALYKKGTVGGVYITDTGDRVYHSSAILQRPKANRVLCSAAVRGNTGKGALLKMGNKPGVLHGYIAKPFCDWHSFRRIPVDILVMASIAALVYQGITSRRSVDGSRWRWRRNSVSLVKVTREGFGYGDSWAILALGIYLGLLGVLDVLAGTFCPRCGLFDLSDGKENV